MSAKMRKLLVTLLLSAGVGFASEARAEDDPPAWDFTLTEEAAPDSMAWDDPARISLTIDTRGADKFSAQINLEAQRAIYGLFGGDRDGEIGGYVRWNRESGGSEQQDNLELGASLDILDSTAMLDRPRFLADPTAAANERRGSVTWSAKLSSGYARTATYPDLSAAPCTTTPTLPQCRVQFTESLRSSLQLVPGGVWQERGSANGTSFSFEPRLGLDHDLLLNGPIDTATGLRTTGGYLSAIGSVKLKLAPGFIGARWELAASAQVRQALSRSTLRADDIEETAELYKLSATYFLLTPTEKSPWRIGLGVVYTNGSDPLTGKPDASTIVVSLRIGRY
jgi:hypothetical protein